MIGEELLIRKSSVTAYREKLGMRHLEAGREITSGQRCWGYERSSGSRDGHWHYRDHPETSQPLGLIPGLCHLTSPVFLSASPFLAFDSVTWGHLPSSWALDALDPPPPPPDLFSSSPCLPEQALTPTAAVLLPSETRPSLPTPHPRAARSHSVGLPLAEFLCSPHGICVK